MNDVTLLDAGLDRLDVLANAAAALLADEGATPPAPVTLRKQLHRRLLTDQRAVLFSLDGTIVGHAIWTLMGPELRLEQFRIASPWRRTGLGSRCLQQLVSQRLGTTSPLIVRVLADNAAAIAFWQANGFREPEAAQFPTPTRSGAGGTGRTLQIMPRPAPP